mmetsp:Transcript_38383/g.75572  ORF Transcript_38383/g.75572 Transcript_38383/m.75572 type:complete len:272 (-) Transcript_38383:124-939(-)
MGTQVSKSAATLRRRDPHNQTFAIALLLILTLVSQKLRGMKAYTFWERVLLCNSVAIYSSYRTASLDAHDDLVKRAGYHPAIYFIGDQVVHLLPALVLAQVLVRHRKFVKPQHGGFALLGQLFFAFSQAGKLDLGEVYVPHDTISAWTAATLGQLFSPSLINNAIQKKYVAAAQSFLCISSPYLFKRLGLRPYIRPKPLPELPAELVSAPLCSSCVATVLGCPDCAQKARPFAPACTETLQRSPPSPAAASAAAAAAAGGSKSALNLLSLV